MTAPAPLVLDASNSWLGNDGNWSSWTLGIGTPSQSFNVIISTSNNEVWVPGPQGCTNHGSPPACAASRGVDSFQESQSLGFQQNESSTWEQIGLYEFLTGGDVFGNNETGLYGLDSVSINSETLENQTVAGIATQDFWLGSLGMSNQSSEFPVREDSIPGLITALKKQNFTPSASFGLSVGASYCECSNP